jgi:ABC-2 type transport system permease protein
MKKILVIARKDVKEAFRSRSTYIFIVVMLVLTISYFSSYNSLVQSLIAENAGRQVIIEQSRLFLTSLAYVLPMMYSIFVCTIFASYSVVLDKAKRNLESLMVTPVSIKQVWLGKSLAVTLPSIMVGISISVLSYIVINYVAVISHTGAFIFPDPLAVVAAFIIVPLLIFAIVSIVTCVQLIISNPRIANLVFTVIFLALLFGANVLAGFGIDINFAVIYAGVVIICAAVSWLLSRSLTKEKVILSSKG